MFGFFNNHYAGHGPATVKQFWELWESARTRSTTSTNPASRVQMSISKCVVRLKDSHDTEHSAIVYAESLYEAVLLGLHCLSDVGWESEACAASAAAHFRIGAALSTSSTPKNTRGAFVPGSKPQYA
jgi:hypothetical protein